MLELERRTSIAGETPLSRAARAGLVLNAAFTILLFYLTAILFMAGFGALALLLLAVALGAARFGLASLVGRLLQVPLRLLGILGRRLWLASSPTYRLELAPHDAPGLFEISRELSRRAALAAPESIAIEMHVNAWVFLRGYRRGRGRTHLGIGFDLLAGLTVSEVEAVLAHELTHARLVQRGFSRWLKKGLARLSQVTTELSACADGYRQANARSDLADAACHVFDGLTRRAARLVATYSRQDEFEADRGAVELCGAAAIRSALARLEVLNDVVSGLPWSERLARLQPGEAFTAWLVSELAGRGRDEMHEPLGHAVDPYSTHPTLHDRLAAMPADDAPLRDTRPGIALLADPDRVANRLISEIQRVIALQEAKDTKRLARDTRKFCRAEGISLVPFVGVVGFVLGLGLALAAIADAFPLGLTAAATAMLAVGLVLVRHRPRDRRPLPVPAFGTLLNPRPPETEEQLRVAEQTIVTELRQSGGGCALGRRRSQPRSGRGVFDRPRLRHYRCPARRACRRILRESGRSAVHAGGEYRAVDRCVAAGRSDGRARPSAERTEVRRRQVHEGADSKRPVSRDPWQAQWNRRATARLYGVDRDATRRIVGVGRAIGPGVCAE
jgi:Zn-dependent protease with chaperone function